MTDYLTKLASRALGVALTAQPVVPSLFAPEPPLARLAGAETEPAPQDVAGLEVDVSSSSPLQRQPQTSLHPALPPFASMKPPHEESVPSQPARPARRVTDADDGEDLLPAAIPLPATGITELDVVDAPSAQPIAMLRSMQAVEQRPVAPTQPSTSQTNMGISKRADEATLLVSSGSTQAMGGVQHAADDGAGRLAAPAIASPAAPAIVSPAAPAIISPAVPAIVSPAAPAIISPAVPATEAEVVEILHTPAAVVLQSRRVAEPTSPAISPFTAQRLPASTPEGLDQVTPLVRPRGQEAMELTSRDPAAGGLGLEGLAAPVLLPLVENEQASRNGSELSAFVGQEMSPSPAPVIEVTIGRVEVRAVRAPQPAVQPKPTPAVAPPLSLEAYLRQQQGRKP